MENSPYKFLDFYTDSVADQRIFFGREREANILVADVVVNRLVVLFARTGTGKTSLINAGVRPRLEKRGYSTFYIRVEQDPTAATRDSMQDFLEANFHLVENNQEAGSLLAQLWGDEELASLSTQLTAFVNCLKTPVALFFDQFEEFFLHMQNNKEARQKFIRDVADLYRNVDSGVHLVFSMREEYYYRMDEFREDIPSIFHKNSSLRLLPLDEDQARDAIIKPAAVLDVIFDPDLANAIIADLNKDKDGIRAPSLQIICDTLWQEEDEQDRHLTLDDYKNLGGAQRILNQRLAQDIEKALGKEPESLLLIQRLLPELRTERGTKIPRLVSELADKLQISSDSVEQLIAPLKDKQIIKSIALANEKAIEWASDYLAEQTELIQDVIKSIELNDIYAKLQQGMRDSDEWPLTKDEFDKLSPNHTIASKLKEDELNLLFDLALSYQSHMLLWFARASGPTYPNFELLKNKIQSKDSRTGVREGILRLLLESGRNEALQVLEEATKTEEPELYKKAIKTIIEFPGNTAFQLLARLLQRDDLWETVVFMLGEAGGNRAIQLLQPLLEENTRFFQALSALESVAKSKNHAKLKAAQSLEIAIPKFASLVKDEATYYKALDALESLIRSSSQIKTETEKRLNVLKEQKTDYQSEIATLKDLIESMDKITNGAERIIEEALPEPAALPETEKEFSQAINVLERLNQYTSNSIRSEAERILVQSAIPDLKKKLTTNSTTSSPRSTLERLAKVSGQIGHLATSVLEDSSVPHATTDEVIEKKPMEGVKSLRSAREKESAIRTALIANTMLNQRFQKARGKLETTETTRSSDIRDLIAFVKNGTVIPVISNSFRFEQIFADDMDFARLFSAEPNFDDEALSVFEQLTQEWANFIEYPMPDKQNLARVAQYFLVEQKDSLAAREKYREFLIDFLLEIAKSEGLYSEPIDRYRSNKWEIPFSRLVRELDFPRFPEGIEDPLQLLARLPLNTYITTSYFSFLEEALEAEGKRPRTQVIFWAGQDNSAKLEHQVDRDFVPSTVNPAVYHLFGLETYPQTMVLSEDDYLKYLMCTHDDMNSQNPVIPMALSNALAKSHLLLLGYRVDDLDFQVLFRLLLTYQGEEFAPRGVLTQLISSRDMDKKGKLERNLSQYFDKRHFDIAHTTPEKFIQTLWEEWNHSR